MVFRAHLVLGVLFAVALARVRAEAARKYTVSGISSGAFMAIQHHVAYNKDVVGVGALAGGPFFCAQGKLAIAMTACMANPSYIDVDELIGITWATYTTTGTIDSPTYTAGDKVWLYSGVQDEKVKSGVVAKTYSYYVAIGADTSDMEFRDDIPSALAMITDNYGNDCTFFGEPYIDNCNFDAAGHLLQHVLGGALKPRVDANLANLVSFSQRVYGPWNITVGLADHGYAYVPTGCQGGRMDTCRLHFVYHGCMQGLENINTTFVVNAGYNTWAEANNIVVVYPQAKSSALNPETCWDWWGYTGPAYASKAGPQLAAMGKMVDDWTRRK